MILVWAAGLIRRRGARLAAVAAGVAVAVALMGTLGVFLASSKATMTDRAVRGVSVDWQVQVQPGADPAAVDRAVTAAPGTAAATPVEFGTTPGFSATTPARTTAAGTTPTSTQTTGAGVVLGLPPGYRSTFPDEIRPLTGATGGVLLFQQTAANLHATPGAVVEIARPGLPPVPVRVEGIVALPQVDSLFQNVGAGPGAQPVAPPDNVLLLPAATWHAVFDPVAAAGAGQDPRATYTQIHALRSHALPTDPAAAYTVATAAAHNLEAATSGAAVVGNNLGLALDKARADAAYAQVLFLFLGLPGAVIAALLTAAVAAAGRDRRRREQALLRARGADTRRLLTLAGTEAAVVAVAGSVAGLAAAAAVGALGFGSASFGATTATAIGWIAVTGLFGVLVAATAVLGPAYRDLRGATVAAGRSTLPPTRAPWWVRSGVDLALLAAGGLVFWLSGAGSSSYSLVLAPEGVPTISISYWAFAGPALVWIGAGLLVWRLVDLALGRGRRLVATGLRPVSGSLAPTAAAMMARRRRPLTRSVVLLGLALAFAASTAGFNATYRAQAEVDAQLTNGADVAVTQPPGAATPPAAAAPIAAVPGVRSVEPLQHRFAYVGADLQDLYGVDPTSIARTTALQDQYFPGGTAAGVLQRLATAPDSVLVSAETAKDFALRPGDLINLRLPDARTGALATVPFHYAGTVTEFPTAPKDSFLVANASYLTATTGSDAVGTFLVDTGGQHTAAVAGALRTRLGPGPQITDIATVRGTIGSSLTAVDLAGLTRVELGFALVLAAAAGGLVLALGLAERRRSFALATALGARPHHLRALAAGEAGVLTVGGLVAGAVIGWGLTEMLVAVLSGVFDPPPATITVPWGYLAAIAVLTVVALAVAATTAATLARRAPTAVLREL